MEETIQIAAFNTRLEADVAVARLADAGIDALIFADNLGDTFPSMQMTTGGYRLHVLVDDAGLAEEVLEEHFAPIEYEPADPGRDDGTGIEWIRSTRLRITLVILTLVAVLAVAYSVTKGTL
jgi:hypothetical protein